MICFDLFICLRSYIFRGIQRWHWLCSCSFRTFCLDPHPGGTPPPSIRLLSIFLFSPTGPRCTHSPSKTLTAMAMATWQVWDTVDRRGGGWIFTVALQGWARHWSTFPLWGLTPSGSLPSSPHPWQTLATTSPTIGGGLKSARMPSFDNILLYIRNEYHIFCDLIVQDNQSNFWYNGRLWYNDGRGKEVDMIWHVCLEWGFCLSNYRSTTNRLLLVHQISKVQPKFCQILWFSGPISVFWIGKTVNFPENKKYYLG